MNFEILSKKQKKKIEELIEKNYGIKFDSFCLIKSGKEKIRIFTGNLTGKELEALNRLVEINNIGLYLCSLKEEELRLSFDAAILFGRKAKKNVISLDSAQAKDWMQGKKIILNAKEDSKIVLVKYKKDILGVAKILNNELLNFVPKERRTNLIDFFDETKPRQQKRN
ncbi:MAG: hypothetical protein QXW65_00850 [Candidatus Pacearchaeota archaeon]